MRLALVFGSAALLALACGSTAKEHLQVQPIGVHQVVVVSQPLPAPAEQATSTLPAAMAAPRPAVQVRPNPAAVPAQRCSGAGVPASLCPPP